MAADEHPFSAFPWGDVEGPLPAGFERQAARDGKRLAVHDEAGVWTYAELNAAANCVAQRLAAIPLERDRPVALLVESSAWFLICVLATHKAGGFYMPLDPRQPVTRSRLLFSESNAAVLVCDAGLIAQAREIAGSGTILPVECIRGEGAGSEMVATGSPDDPAYVLYTSGSTGEPKGVLQTHRNVLADMRRMTNDFGVTAADRFGLLYLPWFSASIGPTFGALLNGGSVHIYPVVDRGVAGLGAWLRDRNISICDMSLAVFRQLTEGPAGQADFRSIRVLGLGGERVTRRDFERFRRHFTEGAVLQNGYGATETRTISQFLLTHETQFPGNVVPVGKPVEGKHVLLRDAEGRDVPVGEPGEIVVRSRYLSPGYWRRPELTDRVFRSADEERSYRTGDLGVWLEDGNLLHLGRLDAQVKIRGHRVEPAEVEDTLLRFPDCREVCVTAETDAAGEAYLACYFVASGEAPPISTIRQRLRDELPAYLIPRRIVLLECLPRLANGKVDLRSLPRTATERPSGGAPLVAPCGALERWIAELAEDVFEVAGLGVDDDFLAIGCDSLQATELLRRVETELARVIPPAIFFRQPTIRGVAQAIEEGGYFARTECVIPIQPQGSRPPLFCLHGIGGDAGNWFRLARALGPDQPVYSLQARGLDGDCEPHRTLTEMAAFYASEIQRVRPEQPIYLFGYSAGGLFAHECARQLAASGRRVERLILIDALDLGDYRRAWQFLRKVNSRLGRWRRGIRVPAPKGTPPPAYRAVRTAIVQAIRHHVPKPYSGSAIFIQPSDPGTLFPQNRHAGWRGLILGGIEVRTASGTHDSLIRSPQIEEWASPLSETLRQASGHLCLG